MPRVTKSPRRRPEQERSKQTVDDILESAAQVLKQVGVQQTTTDRIAARAGLSVGSLYQYFPNKLALFEALMLRHFERVTNTAIAHTGRVYGASAEEFAGILTEIMLTPERRDPQLSALLHQIAATHESVAAVEVERTKLFELTLATLLREKRGTAGFRADMDPDLASRVLARSLAGLLRRTMEIDPALIESDAFTVEVRRLICGYLLER
jgi:AcrR family transcriptional regulator